MPLKQYLSTQFLCSKYLSWTQLVLQNGPERVWKEKATREGTARPIAAHAFSKRQVDARSLGERILDLSRSEVSASGFGWWIAVTKGILVQISLQFSHSAVAKAPGRPIERHWDVQSLATKSRSRPRGDGELEGGSLLGPLGKARSDPVFGV